MKPLLTEEEQQRIRQDAELAVANDCGNHVFIMDAETTMQLFDIIDALKAKIGHKHGVCLICDGKGYTGEQFPKGCWNCSGTGRK